MLGAGGGLATGQEAPPPRPKPGLPGGATGGADRSLHRTAPSALAPGGSSDPKAPGVSGTAVPRPAQRSGGGAGDAARAEAGTVAGLTRAGEARRIVSINACTDQILFKLVPPERIAALSIYAADPTLSIYAGEVLASGIPLIRGTVEEVLKLDPDLVLAGTWTRSLTREQLALRGIPLKAFAAPSTLDEVKAGIRLMGELVGAEHAANAMVRAIDAALQRNADLALGRLSALQFQRRGYTSGEATLLGDVMRKVGLRNAAGGLGVHSVERADLETVLKVRADLLILLDPNPDAADQGTALLQHPALLAAYPPERRLVLANNLTVCGGPALVTALDTLAGALRGLVASR